MKAVQQGNLWASKHYKLMLKDLSDPVAFNRPHPQLHTIAEIIAHMTFWRAETLLKIKTGKGMHTDDSPGNWQENSTLLKIGWRKLKSDYDDSFNELILLISQKEDDFLDQTYEDPDFKGNYPYRFVLDGMLHHDLYHLGQMGMLLKLIQSNN